MLEKIINYVYNENEIFAYSFIHSSSFLSLTMNIESNRSFIFICLDRLMCGFLYKVFEFKAVRLVLEGISKYCSYKYIHEITLILLFKGFINFLMISTR